MISVEKWQEISEKDGKLLLNQWKKDEKMRGKSIDICEKMAVNQCMALDGALIPKFSKRHFFQDIRKSFHGVTQVCLKPHQNFFQKFFSTNMVAREVQSFCILMDATDPLI